MEVTKWLKPSVSALQCRSNPGRGVPRIAIAATTSSQNGSTQPRDRLESQARQQQPLAAQHQEEQQSGSNIHRPYDRRQRGGESPDGIGNACNSEGNGKPLGGELGSSPRMASRRRSAVCSVLAVASLAGNQFTLMPATLTTFVQCSISSAIGRSKSAAVPVDTTDRLSYSRA
jgi:hypothetical protein